MITIDDLKAGYGSESVLKGLGLTLEKGKVYGLIGLNGSGKTTLLKCISKLHQYDSGSILIDGNPPDRKRISFLETEPYFYHGITGREFLRLFTVHGMKNFDTDAWGAVFNLEIDKLIDNYSTGMKKKLALLMVICQNRDLIMLDEPFNGLDLESARVLTKIIEKLKKPSRTILITSHILDTLNNICDSIFYLENGIIQKSFSGNEYKVMEKEVFAGLDKKIDETINKLLP